MAIETDVRGLSTHTVGVYDSVILYVSGDTLDSLRLHAGRFVVDVPLNPDDAEALAEQLIKAAAVARGESAR